MTSYPISAMADQDVGMNGCANFVDSMLRPSEASFSALFRTSITSSRKNIVSDVISSVILDMTGMKVRAKFGVSK